MTGKKGPNAHGADLISRYNYEAFTPEELDLEPRFEESPPLGKKALDFPLWTLDGVETRLSDTWSAHDYTIVEFGSFT